MRTFYFILALAGAATSACKSHPAAKTTAPTIPSSSSTADADDIGAPKYAVCDGQGGNAQQLAPAFLDHMASCQASDSCVAFSFVKAEAMCKFFERAGEYTSEEGVDSGAKRQVIN